MRAMSVESTRAANAGATTYECSSCGKRIKVGFWSWLFNTKKPDYYASKPMICPGCNKCFPTWEEVEV